MNFDDLPQSKFSHVILFGAPKTGKTKLAGETAQKFKLKWIDLESGSATLKQLPEEWRKNIDIISIPDNRNFPIACQTILKMFTLQKGTICYVHGNWNCPTCMPKGLQNLFQVDLTKGNEDEIYVIDSITQLAQSFMSHIMKPLWVKDAEAMPEWKHYAHQGNLLATVMSQIQTGKYNIICISHEIQADTPDEKSKLVPIAGTRNFSATVAKFFDTVVYSEIRAKQHKFGSGSTYGLNVITGSRTNLEISTMQKPSLLPFFDKSYIPNDATAPNDGTKATIVGTIVKDKSIAS